MVSIAFIMIANHDDQFFNTIYYSIYVSYVRKLKKTDLTDLLLRHKKSL